jgi:hypothetical protein
VGDPDLSPDDDTHATQLADSIRAGDHAAIAGFRGARSPRVEAYVAQVCAPELADQAVSAAFVDFLARIAAAPGNDAELDRLLLAATRSAAAGRFTVASPPGRTLAIGTECQAMPELLAAHAADERPADEGLISGHLAGCSVCAHTLARMQDAERAFAAPSGALPALELRETSVDTTTTPPSRPRPTPPPHPRPTSPPRPTPSAQPASPERGGPEPLVEPEGSRPIAAPPPAHGLPSTASPAPGHHPPAAPARGRSGGLVGAIKKFSRTIRT